VKVFRNLANVSKKEPLPERKMELPISGSEAVRTEGAASLYKAKLTLFPSQIFISVG